MKDYRKIFSNNKNRLLGKKTATGANLGWQEWGGVEWGEGSV